MITKASILTVIPQNLQDSAIDTLADLVETLSSRGDDEGAMRILQNINNIVRTRQQIVDNGANLDYALGRHLE